MSELIGNSKEADQKSTAVTPPIPIDSITVAADVIKALRSAANSNRFYKQNATRDDVTIDGIGHFNKIVEDNKKNAAVVNGSTYSNSPSQKAESPVMKNVNRHFAHADPTNAVFGKNNNTSRNSIKRTTVNQEDNDEDDDSTDGAEFDLGFDRTGEGLDDESLGSAHYEQYDYLEDADSVDGVNDASRMRSGKKNNKGNAKGLTTATTASNKSMRAQLELSDRALDSDDLLGDDEYISLDDQNPGSSRIVTSTKRNNGRPPLDASKRNSQFVDEDDALLFGDDDDDDSYLFGNFTAPVNAPGLGSSGSSSKATAAVNKTNPRNGKIRQQSNSGTTGLEDKDRQQGGYVRNRLTNAIASSKENSKTSKGDAHVPNNNAPAGVSSRVVIKPGQMIRVKPPSKSRPSRVNSTAKAANS